MYGTLPPAPPRRRAARLGAVLLRVLVRVVLTAVPLASLGMLGWIPMLRLALVHRRTRDWLLFGVSVATGVGGMVLIGGNGDEHSWQDATGVLLLLGTAVSTAAYYLAVDLAPCPLPAPVPTPAPAPTPVALPRQDRLSEVRAGLDELSAYLQQQDRT